MKKILKSITYRCQKDIDNAPRLPDGSHRYSYNAIMRGQQPQDYVKCRKCGKVGKYYSTATFTSVSDFKLINGGILCNSCESKS